MIYGIDNIKPIPPIANGVQPTPKVADGESFGDTLSNFVGNVNKTQLEAIDKTNQFATGQIQDVHEVMAAVEEASISLSLLLEIRKKALEGYQELMRTPV
ncbi:MAG: flagellar hook-basal body complex protein FliE [Calditrichaeota bacterium]|nr:flagellar hook-basal body complex protein FliE [Calditrichota bacterium]MCB9368828.1 flagellar hook-basal body complex protein FliE [Calditrichota bacterium]